MSNEGTPSNWRELQKRAQEFGSQTTADNAVELHRLTTAIYEVGAVIARALKNR